MFVFRGSKHADVIHKKAAEHVSRSSHQHDQGTDALRTELQEAKLKFYKVVTVSCVVKQNLRVRSYVCQIVRESVNTIIEHGKS